MLRAIREIQPTWIVGENVRGPTNWNGGLVFDEVQAELEAQGYEVTPFLLPACAVNAPHRRDRIWFIAYSSSASKRANELRSLRSRGIWERKDNESIGICKENIDASNSNLYGCNECDCNNEVNTSEGRFDAFSDIDKSNDNGNASDPNGSRQQAFDSQKSILGEKNTTTPFSRNSIKSIHRKQYWQSFPSVPPIHYGDDGISDRLDGITFSKWRQESIKAGGNAIVPQVVFQIFKAIDQYNQLNKQLTL
jgi:DNA (cytosine-5)-methyltransferase 1